MKMRSIAFVCLTFAACWASAQVSSGDENCCKGEKSLFERVAKIEKKSDRFNLYMNMHGSFDAKFNQGGVSGFNQGAFNMSQLRIEAKGNITDWLSYRWRQRLNRSNDGNNMIDNLPNSIDYAAIGVKFNKHLSVFAGKQAAAYGGFEYDLNPIEIYQYSEMINNMSNFMTGVTLIYDITPNQQLQFQILDSRNGSQAATYGDNLKESRLPLVYTVNWNANMLDNVWQTRWSASIMEETHGKYMYYFALGNNFNISKNWNMYVDIMSSTEQLDRKGIMTSMFGADGSLSDGRSLFNDHNMFNTMYNSLVAKVNFRFCPKWNFFLKGMFESAAVYKDYDNVEKGNYRTSLGYVTGFEYYPMESNLHFYLAFIGQSHFFTDRAKALGRVNNSTQRVSLGFIYQLPLF